MATSLLVALVPLLFLAHEASGQITAPPCTDPAWNWTFNSQGNNPCEVAATLQSVCFNGQFKLDPLRPGNTYIGPAAADGGDVCKCNTVTYSLMSACDGCQGGPWSPWSVWAANCTTQPQDGVYPKSLPDGIKVPGWAYLQVIDQNNFNNLTARNTGDTPESSAGSGATNSNPSSTGTSTSTSTSTSHGSSHAGAIAGGVVGGVVGLALIGALIAFFLIRRRRSRVAPSSAYSNGGGMRQDSAHAGAFMPETPKKYYNPSDPSTYPTSAASPPIAPTIHTTSDAYHGYENDRPQPNRTEYTGLPEV